jgi:hypothetical protein
VGSGRGDGPSADATILRSQGGLPYVPGRGVKGLLRDGCQQAEWLGLLEQGTTERLFGERTALLEPGEREVGRRNARDTRPGALRFCDARLPEDHERYAAEHPDWAACLVDVLAATRLEDGVAKGGTLRTTEVAVPVTLEANVEGPDGDWPEALRVACRFVRALGSHRNRGLGRARLELLAEPEEGRRG